MYLHVVAGFSRRVVVMLSMGGIVLAAIFSSEKSLNFMILCALGIAWWAPRPKLLMFIILFDCVYLLVIELLAILLYIARSFVSCDTILLGSAVVPAFLALLLEK